MSQVKIDFSRFLGEAKSLVFTKLYVSFLKHWSNDHTQHCFFFKLWRQKANESINTGKQKLTIEHMSVEV